MQLTSLPLKSAAALLCEM